MYACMSTSGSQKAAAGYLWDLRKPTKPASSLSYMPDAHAQAASPTGSTHRDQEPGVAEAAIASSSSSSSVLQGTAGAHSADAAAGRAPGILCLSVHEDGALAAAGCDDGRVLVWDMRQVRTTAQYIGAAAGMQKQQQQTLPCRHLDLCCSISCVQHVTSQPQSWQLEQQKAVIAVCAFLRSRPRDLQLTCWSKSLCDCVWQLSAHADIGVWGCRLHANELTPLAAHTTCHRVLCACRLLLHFPSAWVTQGLCSMSASCRVQHQQQLVWVALPCCSPAVQTGLLGCGRHSRAAAVVHALGTVVQSLRCRSFTAPGPRGVSLVLLMDPLVCGAWMVSSVASWSPTTNL